MKLTAGPAGAPALALLFALSALPAACASSRSTKVATGTPASSSADAADLAITRPARPVAKAPLGPTLDRQGCDPKGHFTLVVQQGAKGEPTFWRYYSVAKRGGTRVLRCEAADNNGDGFVDARFFYDEAGQLVLEQRDLDFDGHAEVIADYSHFSVGHLVQASQEE
jgi:hypothetical protein